MRRKVLFLIAFSVVLVAAVLVVAVATRQSENTSATSEASAVAPVKQNMVRPAVTNAAVIETAAEPRRSERIKAAERRSEERAKANKERKAQREAKREEALRRLEREEALPPELRYRNHPQLPKGRAEQLAIRRDLRHLSSLERRYPERAEEIRARREKLLARLEELEADRRAKPHPRAKDGAEEPISVNKKGKRQ